MGEGGNKQREGNGVICVRQWKGRGRALRVQREGQYDGGCNEGGGRYYGDDGMKWDGRH